MAEFKPCKNKQMTQVTRSLPHRALMQYESELTASLLTNAPDSILKLAKMAQDRELVTLELFTNLESLDSSVPYRLRCRYLMLHIYKSMTSNTFSDWLEALSKVEGTTIVLSLVKHYYRVLKSSQASCTVTVDGNELLFGESDVPILTEVLAGCSNRWKEIAVSLWLPSNKIDNISALMLKPVLALKEVFLSWVQREFQNAKPPTLQVLEKVLRSEVVGLGAEANSLKTKIDSQYAEYRTKKSAVELVASTRVCSQTPDASIQEGNAVLLEVQIAGEPQHYRWFKDNHGHWVEIKSMKYYYLGTEENILYVFAKDLTLDGHYMCKVLYVDKIWLSKPIHLTVHTPLDEYQQILIDRYTVLPVIPEDTWPPVHSGSFINLALIKQESIHKAGTIRGNVDDILKDKESITYDQAMDCLSCGARLLIEGRPGSGKTTLVHKFIQDWARMKKSITHVRLLLYIQLRGFASDPNIGLRDIIGCYYRDHPGMDDIVRYAIKHNGLGLCFILDGLDEYLPQKKEAFIFELIRKRVLPKSVVIVASRPAAAADFRSIATRQVEVLGFLRAQIYDYVEEYPFPAEYRTGLRQYLDKHPNILNMCYLPIHASMICFLYNKISADLPETETEIYSKFTKFAMLRTLYRSHSRSEISLESFGDLPPSKKEQYLQICNLAFKMTVASEQVMQQEEVNKFFATREEKELFGLMTVDNMDAMCGFQDLYTFLHLTFQEFFAAYYISSLDKEGQMDLIKKHGKATHMKQVWRFYCGLLKCDECCVKSFDALVNEAQHGTLFDIQCSFESQQCSTCDSVVQNNCLHFADTSLTSSDFTAMAFVISNAQKQKVITVVLDRCTIGLDGVDTLVKKAYDRLSLITTLCFHGYDCANNQLRVVNKLLYWLSYLKILDVTNTNLNGNLTFLVRDLNHSSLEIVKVSSTQERLFGWADTLASSFFMGCINFINVCFSGSKIESSCLPYCFYCNCKDINMSFCKLRTVEYELLSSDLVINSNLTTRLTLIDCGIDDYAASCLARGIGHCTALEIVELSCNSISDHGAYSFADVSIYDHKLHTLDLSCNRISDKGAISIAHATRVIEGFKLRLWNNCLSKFKKKILAVMPNADLQTFEVLDRDIRDSNATSLSSIVEKACKDCRQDLMVLRLTGCSVSLEGVESLATILKCCDKLQSFTYSSSLTISGSNHTLTAIIKALENCKCLHSLSIVLGADGAGPLADLLGRHKSFSRLDISHSHIDINGAQILGNAFKSCQITSLDISSCSIGEAGAAVLNLNAKLQELNLSANKIESSGACAMAKALARCTHLTMLDISCNNISTQGAQALGNSLVHCTSLTKLAVDCNAIGESGASGLVKALKRCTNLTILTISRNDIGNGGAKALLGALKRCTKLRVLNVSYNNIHGSVFTTSLKYWKDIQELDFTGNHS